MGDASEETNLPDLSLLDSLLDKSQREEVEREARRGELMREIARRRWHIAQHHHRLDNNQPLDFERYPFQRDIYQDDALSLVVVGSTQWGKALDLSTYVQTTCGWKQNGELKVGDRVLTPDGLSSDITHVFPQGVVCLRVITLADGRRVKGVCTNHLWKTWVDGVVSVIRTKDIERLIRAGKSVYVPVDDAYRSYKQIVSVEPCGCDKAQCIMIDHPDHLYITEGGIVTHNSEFLICTAASMAACDLSVFYVLDKYDKRDKFVKSRIDVTFGTVPLYRAAIQAAKKRNAKAESARFKHFGSGSINFVGSNSDGDFSTYKADASIVDEHQLCDQDNIAKIFDRMSGSPWRFQIIVGNPRLVGTRENQNLDFQYQESDRRQWHIPCDHCGHYQVLGWWSHFVREEKNKAGGIISIAPRDGDFHDDSVTDMRPICTGCCRPMNRLHPDGKWVPMNPGHRRHGYQLSNLYNVNVRMGGPLSLYSQYIAALHSPTRMADLVNNQLGMAWNMEGTSITEQMLQAASTGVNSGLSPYGFKHASEIVWRGAA